MAALYLFRTYLRVRDNPGMQEHARADTLLCLLLAALPRHFDQQKQAEIYDPDGLFTARWDGRKPLQPRHINAAAGRWREAAG